MADESTPSWQRIASANLASPVCVVVIRGQTIICIVENEPTGTALTWTPIEKRVVLHLSRRQKHRCDRCRCPRLLRARRRSIVSFGPRTYRVLNLGKCTTSGKMYVKVKASGPNLRGEWCYHGVESFARRAAFIKQTVHELAMKEGRFSGKSDNCGASSATCSGNGCESRGRPERKQRP
jgi:hypothetical protein